MQLASWKVGTACSPMDKGVHTAPELVVCHVWIYSAKLLPSVLLSRIWGEGWGVGVGGVGVVGAGGGGQGRGGRGWGGGGEVDAVAMDAW